MMVLAGCLFTISNQNSCRIPQLDSSRKFPTKPTSIFPTWDPSGIFQLKQLLHRPARVHSKISQQSPMGRPQLIHIHRTRKIPPCAPSSTILPFHTNRRSFHTTNLLPILLSHPGSLHLPYPDSVSHMGYTRPPSHLHISHCTRIPVCIPLPGTVPDASSGYSCESSRIQVLRSDSYPANSHSLVFVSVKPASSIG